VERRSVGGGGHKDHSVTSVMTAQGLSKLIVEDI